MAKPPATPGPSLAAPPYRADRLLIKPLPSISLGTLAEFHAAQGCQVLRTFEGIGRLQIISIPVGTSVSDLVSRYQQSGLVEFAEPDYVGQIAATPNDPKYLDGTLWALNNTGQNGGTADADIDAPEGWDVLNSASNIVVAVLDTGIRATHEDLAANVWVNPIDGGPGFNAFTGTNNPSDDASHGTMISGVLGGVGNNGKGVAGVAWRVRIMACKCFNSLGQGTVSDVVTCLDYARTNGARIINASWGFSTNSLALSNALESARSAGIICVAACGNLATNIDINPSYPSGYHLDNVVSVAATTRNDVLWTSSNYGPTNVHLAAPGVQIYSTFPATDNFYFTDSSGGTSYSAPYVSGALALMLARFPSLTYTQVISLLLATTDPLPSLAGKCVTGGRLNLRNALSPPLRLKAALSAGQLPLVLHVSAGPNQSWVIQASTNLSNWSPLVTNSTSGSGTFDYIDTQFTNAPCRFYRVASTP